MFIRITQLEVKPDQWSAFLEKFETSTIPFLESQVGFMRVICTGDEASASADIISMWQNEEQGGGSGRGGPDPALAGLEEFLVSDPVTSGHKEILEREF